MQRTLRSITNFTDLTPSVLGSKHVKAKRLTEAFSKIPVPKASKKLTEGKKVSLHSPKKKNEVLQKKQSRKEKSTIITSPSQIEAENGDEMEAEPATQVEDDCNAEPATSEVSHQRSIKFYFYPVADATKWIREALVKSRPPRKRTPKKLRTPATDELTEVMLWRNPLTKRTLQNLTDLEVAFTMCKNNIQEYCDCVTNRKLLFPIQRYEELLEKGIVEKLKGKDVTHRMLQEINKLSRANKELSQKLGSLIDHRIRLRAKRAGRNASRTE